MQDVIPVEIPGVGSVDFPASMSETEINAAAKRLYDDAQRASPAAATTRDEPSIAPLVGAASTGLIPAAVAGAKRAAEHVATSPVTTKATGAALRLGRRVIPTASAGATLYQLSQGDIPGAAKSAASGAALRYGPTLLSRAAQTAATALPASPAAVGAGAGLTLPVLVLAALQRDVNRRPTIDPEADTPAATILRGFQTIAGQRRPR